MVEDEGERNAYGLHVKKQSPYNRALIINRSRGPLECIWPACKNPEPIQQGTDHSFVYPPGSGLCVSCMLF